MRTIEIVAFGLALALATGCGKDDPKKGGTNIIPTAQAATPPAAPEPVAPPAALKPKEHVEIEIASVGNTMTFDKKALSVPAGAEVHLTFKNNAPPGVLAHNWVLVKPGTEASVAAAGLKLGDRAGYLDVSDHDVIAFTPLAKPGESTDVTFTAPVQPGAYPYVCTFPGHYMMMKGVLTVTL
ncbi:MAG TPA: plastocyanin/azurin family copper-binding protein [Polyangiaceae bacterium]|nr:plastocyanin/azurin family copper-binding protein [Polyangiaceae bacterium]